MAPPRVLAGASGYSYKEWKGPFYPAGLKNDDMLGYYAERLPTVEINNTFYRMPKRSVLEDWAAKTPAGFRFVLKASRRITHQAKLKDCQEALDYLFGNAAVLGDKLGPILFQLPPYLKKDVGLLKDFLAMLPEDARAVLEFRSSSWQDDAVYEVLRANNTALCIADRDDASKTMPVVPTADFGYLRLRREDYGDADLQAWAKTIATQPWSEASVFFKHEDEGAAPKLALRLMELVRG